jgi:hypothetical protein
VNRWSSLVNGWSSLVDGWSSLVDGRSSLVNGRSTLINGWSSPISRWVCGVLHRGTSLVDWRVGLCRGSGLINGGSGLVNGWSSLVNGWCGLINGWSSLVNGWCGLINGWSRTRRRLMCVVWRGNISWVAVEIDVMEPNLAVIFVSFMALSKVHLDLTSATTLGVLDNGSVLLARSDVLADGVVGHLVMELDISVVLDGDLHLLDGEAFLLALAVEGSRLVLANLVLDALGLEGSLGQVVPLAKAVGALPTSLEFEVVITLEVTLRDILPVVPILLLVGTLIVVVLWSIEVARMTVPSGSHLLDS